MTSLSGTSSLRLGERLIAWSDDGLLAAEYALFDPAEVVLHASDPVTVREAGYMTTARQALGRLAAIGATPELADSATEALARGVVSSYARGSTSRAVAPELGAQEIFDGAIYRASADAQYYEGTWLDLHALAEQLELPAAPLLLQALHLAATLVEVGGETTLHLATTGAMRERRPGERTHYRPALDLVRGVPDALRRVRPRATPVVVDAWRESRLRPALVARVRERLSRDATPRLRTHLAVLDRALGEVDPDERPLADDELRAVDQQLDDRDLRDVAERIEQLERARGSVAGVRYLKARLALLRGEEAPREVAQELSGIVEGDRGFHRAALVAARTWLAAGEEGHARYFAHGLAEDIQASDSERLIALEILATVPATAASHVPPPLGTAQASAEPVIPPAPRPARYVGLGDVPPPAPGAPRTVPPPPVMSSGTELQAPSGLIRYEPELVESLPLPLGAGEQDLGVNQRPETPMQARIAMIRLARDLARDYRLWYGRSLRCDVIAIDGMQGHLAHRFAGADITREDVAWELRRHGALLSEILARKLAGGWADIAPSEPGYWAMIVPPGLRTHPIGRVYRFVSLGQNERDLVSYFIDLEARVRGA